MKDIINNRFLLAKYLLFFIGFTLPFSSAINSISIALLFILSLTFLKKESFFSNNRLELSFIAFFFYILLSVSYSASFEKGVSTVLRSSVLFIFPLIFISLKNKLSSRHLTAAILGLALSVLSNLIVIYISIVLDLFRGNLLIGDIVREPFVNRGFYRIHIPYYSMLIVFLIFSIYLAPFKNKRKYLALKKIVITILSISLFFVSGFMSICIFFLLVFFLYLYKTNKKNRFISLITIISISSLFMFTIKNLDKFETNVGSESFFYRLQKFLLEGDSSRIITWKSAVAVIQQNPLLGIGADGGIEELQKYRPLDSEPYINKHNAHNELLELFLRYGVLGLILFLNILFYLIKSSFKSKNIPFIFFLLIFLLSGLTESLIQRQIGIVFFTLFSLLYYFTSYNDNEIKINK